MSKINTIIKSPTSAYIETSIAQALVRLNEKDHIKGEPDVVAYYDEDKINAIFTIGTKNGRGSNSYKVISIRECDMIWGILTTLPQTIEKGKTYLYKNTENNWLLVSSNSKIPVPEKTYIDLSTGKTYIAKNGTVRGIWDFYTKTEVDKLILDNNTENNLQANWIETSPTSKAYIKNRPTSFSGFEDDFVYSLLKLDITTPGFHSSYQLTLNNEPIGDIINIPKDHILKTGVLSKVTAEDKQQGGKFYNDPTYSIDDPYIDLIEGDDTTNKHIYISLKDLKIIYSGGEGININNNTINANIIPGNGLKLTNDGKIKIDSVNNSSNGSMPPADVQKLDSIDLEDITIKEKLLSGEVEVELSQTTKNIAFSSDSKVEVRSDGFSFRSTAGKESVGIGNAIVKKIGGTNTPFIPESLKTFSNNAIIPENKKENTIINNNTTISGPSSVINYTLYWFPCIKGYLSSSVYDLKNNGYAITSGNESLGNVGFSTTEPTPSLITIDRIIEPIITPYSNQPIHYLPPDNGWLIVSVKNEVKDKLCARLSWSAAFDSMYETPENYELQLPGKALGKTVNGDTVEDYWYDHGGYIYFHKAYGEVEMTTEKWGNLITSTGDHDPSLFKVRYRGSIGNIQILSEQLTVLPESMWIDDNENPTTVTRTYNFGDDLVHEIRYKFGSGIELPMKAFSGVEGITSVIIPLSGRILNLDCFKDCTNLTTITLSPSTNYIGSRCFQSCNSLSTVRIYNPIPATIYNNTFPESCNFYIPGTYINDYTSNSVWSEFGERLKQGRGTRYYYRYNELRGLIKEYTLFTLGFQGISVTDMGSIEIEVNNNEVAAPEGILYYELKRKVETNLHIPSSYKVWDYGTECFKSGQESGNTEIIYPTSLYDDLRHSRTLLSEKIEKTNIDTEINDNSNNPVQNSVIKNYIDTTIMEATDICRDLSRIDSFGNPMSTRNTANCYIISKPGKYKIPLIYGNAIKNGADNKKAYTKLDYYFHADFYNALGNPITQPEIEEDTGTTVVSGGLVWESNEMIKDRKVEVIPGTLVNFLTFEVTSIPETGGNAVISAINNNNIVVWSWHLWITKENLKPVSIWNNIPADGPTGGMEYKIMPINLGWTWDDSTKAHGKSVFYQWGRKDPIPGPAAYNSGTNPNIIGSFTYNGGNSGTVPLSIKNPNKFYLKRGSYNNWCDLDYFYNYWNSENTIGTGRDDLATRKTIYDPSPFGWKIPHGNVHRGFTTTGISTVHTGSTKNTIGSFSSGWKFMRYYGDSVGIYYPAIGYRAVALGSVIAVGVGGYYWSSASYSQAGACCLYFDSGGVGPGNYDSRANGFSVRPILQ